LIKQKLFPRIKWIWMKKKFHSFYINLGLIIFYKINLSLDQSLFEDGFLRNNLTKIKWVKKYKIMIDPMIKLYNKRVVYISKKRVNIFLIQIWIIRTLKIIFFCKSRNNYQKILLIVKEIKVQNQIWKACKDIKKWLE